MRIAFQFPNRAELTHERIVPRLAHFAREMAVGDFVPMQTPQGGIWSPSDPQRVIRRSENVLDYAL